MQISFIRHPPPAITSGICYGRSDVPLVPDWHNGASSLKQRLSKTDTAAVFSSPAQRCVQLATWLQPAPVIQDKRLVELDFGLWEMQPWHMIKRSALDAWAADPVIRTPPGGESFADLQRRAQAFLHEILPRYRGQEVIVFTHAGVIRALLADALGLPLGNSLRIACPFNSLTRIEYTDNLPHVAAIAHL